MSEATTAATVTPATLPVPERRVYAASGGRKLAFSFIFLVLLPFFISLPPMLFWRLTQGHWSGTLGLMVLAIAFGFIMLLVLVELLHSLLARIEIGDTAVKLTLPAARGPSPWVRYRSHEIPYDKIKAIETRREIYGGEVAPVLLNGARIILKDYTPIKLGYVSEANSDPCFPYPDIARQIAEHAGVPIEHRGNVRRSAQRKLLGFKFNVLGEAEGDVHEEQIETLNRSHRSWVMRLIWLLCILVVVGIALDIIFPPSSGLPPALTSLTSFVSGDAPASKPAEKDKH
jgi:hypothetical protein